jgi:hypothetical protein
MEKLMLKLMIDFVDQRGCCPDSQPCNSADVFAKSDFPEWR